MAEFLIWLIAALGAVGGVILGRVWGRAEGERLGKREAERDAMEDKSERERAAGQRPRVLTVTSSSPFVVGVFSLSPRVDTATATRHSASAPSGCASRVLRLCSL